MSKSQLTGRGVKQKTFLKQARVPGQPVAPSHGFGFQLPLGPAGPAFEDRNSPAP